MSLLLARLWPSFQGLSCLLAFYALLRIDKVVAESQRYFRIVKPCCSLLDDSLGRLLHCITPILAISLYCIRRGSRPGSGLGRPTTEQCMTRKTTAVPIQFELCPAALCQPRSNCPSSVRPLCRIVRSGILALSAVPVQSTFGLWSSLCFCLAQFTNIICLLCYLRSSSG